MGDKIRPLDEGLEKISIVLVEPQGPANIGATARAMANHGLSRLILVNPCEYNNDECFSRACNAGAIVLEARLFSSLKECVSEFGFVMGTTRRLGKQRETLLDISGAVSMIMDMNERNAAAILFGREDRGLLNTELALCDAFVELPTHEDYPSLNLSHAVFLLTHYLFMASCAHGGKVHGGRPLRSLTAAPRDEIDKMYIHMEETLRALDYGTKGKEFLLRAVLHNFRRLFGRTALLEKEVNMLRGIFSQILIRLGR